MGITGTGRRHTFTESVIVDRERGVQQWKNPTKKE